VIGSKQINDLPLNGRNFTFLAQISAGVTPMQQDSRGFGASGGFSANGVRSESNNYLLDGIDNNNDSQDFLNGTFYVALPPVDAIAEFKVETANYSAEFGRAGGAVMNATLKSGTNEFHGNAWEFLRNDKLDAADFFNNAAGLGKGAFRQTSSASPRVGRSGKTKRLYSATTRVPAFDRLSFIRRPFPRPSCGAAGSRIFPTCSANPQQAR
jgi:TonB-dependent Receptor Plug Domain